MSAVERYAWGHFRGRAGLASPLARSPPMPQVRSFKMGDIVLSEVEGLDSKGANVSAVLQLRVTRKALVAREGSSCWAHGASEEGTREGLRGSWVCLGFMS